jgi:uncharacterized YigZ family protein
VSGYLALSGPATAEIEVRRSRFLCTLERVDSEDAARALVARLRREHPDARHHCSAFVIGPPPVPVERSSDDGEPAGTAGAPMLEVLRGSGLSDVAAVVTRWFGGTLLGTGGLARAYADAVRAGLSAAATVRRELRVEHELVLDHAHAAAVENALRTRGVAVLDAAYGAAVTLRLGAAVGDDLDGLVAELTGGAAETRVLGERWVDSLGS